MRGARILPEYRIKIQDRTYRVELAKQGDHGLFEASVNDEPVKLELLRGQTDTTEPMVIKVAGKEYHIDLKEVNRRRSFTCQVNNIAFKAELLEPERKIPSHVPVAPALAKRREKPGEGAIVAPMAGKIVSVKVEQGGAVKAGDVVCILEAMKMENEILAPKAGIVQEILVLEGSPVNDGEVLVVVK